MRVLIAALCLAAAAARPDLDQDFEFVENADIQTNSVIHSRRPRQYVFDPKDPLCSGVACAAGEVCAVLRGRRAYCVPPPPAPAPADTSPVGTSDEDLLPLDSDDVFYDNSVRAADPDRDLDRDLDPMNHERCVGCGRVRSVFLCGSDNRTYSSLCRLDLHNCVRRPRPPVTLACRGDCPCERRRPRRLDLLHNDVLSEIPHSKSADPQDVHIAGCNLDALAARLLDWFSVLQAAPQTNQATRHIHPENGFPIGCLPEVRWMFSHLDTDGDGVLSEDNLYALSHDDSERCLPPFLASCGLGAAAGAGAGGVTRARWCGCLRGAARPCALLQRQHQHPQRGAYVPSCDARGYYRPRQCHRALRVCWCVDAHGVERPGTRQRGRVRCPANVVATQPPVPASPARVGAPPADDEDGLGSGDAELY